MLLDFSSLAGQERSFGELLEQLKRRGIRIVGVEGVNPNRLGDDMPPVLGGGRHVSIAPDEAPAAEIKPPEPISLLVDKPVRFGSERQFPERGRDGNRVGGVGVGGAGGGARSTFMARCAGRAIAGLLGSGQGAARPRIFCRRLEAELLAIDGVYRTADEFDPALHRRAVQAWLEGDQLVVAAMD